MTVIFILFTAICVNKIVIFHTDPATMGIEKGQVFDLWISMLACMIIWAARIMIEKTCTETVISLLKENRNSGNEQKTQIRINIILKWIFDFIYYSMTIAFCMVYFRDQAFWPVTLGGEGSCTEAFMNYPEVPEIPFIKEFYLVQLGCRI